MLFSRKWITRTTISALALGIGLMFSVPGIALAHEHRDVSDNYQLVFGWRVEPAVTGVINGPEVFIEPAGAGEEAEGAPLPEGFLQNVDVALQVEVTFGPASRTLELTPVFGETGHYIADMIPTRPGDYTFHLTGTIGDLAIDETFTSADGYFDSVDPASDLEFPEPQPDVSALLQRIETLEAQVQALQAQQSQ